MSSIKTKLLFLMILITIVPLTTLGILSYHQTTKNFTKSTQDFLLTIIKSKEKALEQYIDSTEKIGKAIGETDVMQNYLSYKQQGLFQQSSSQYQEIEKQVENLLYSFQEANWGKYHHIFLIDKSKKIVISPNHGAKVKGSPSSHLNEDTSKNTWAMQALAQGHTAVSDYSSWVESDHSHQMLFYPVRGKNGIRQAVIGFELQIPHEEKILSEDFELGETGRVFLATTDGVPIVYKGIGNQSPLNTPGILEAKSKGFSSGRRNNAEGKEVIDLYLKHNKYPWILVAEIETREAFRDLYKTQYTIIAIVSVTLLIVLILSIFFANFIVKPIIRLTGQMEEVSLGNLDVKVAYADRKDEIGSLVQAFARMVLGLKVAMANYDESIAATSDVHSK